jgi:anthranilate phosphoribosyltransferase
VATLAALGGWSAALSALTSGTDLSAEQAEAAMAEILAGEASPAQIAGFIVALRMKGETVDELSGLLAAMYAAADQVALAEPDGVVDVVGTGGDRHCSINVSTLSALVVAGAGGRVCKHGNRAASSDCGSADVLEALGVVIDLGPDGVARCVSEAGIGFCFAPRFHPAMRFAGPPRRELGVPTVFNFLGPLANPAGVRRQLIGVSDPSMAERMLSVLASRGSQRVLVVFGHDGLDELTITTTSTVFDLADGVVTTYEVDPSTYGFSGSLESLRGGDAAANAAAARRVLDGEAGPQRDVVVLNAGAALVAAGMVDSLGDGVTLAASVLGDGRAAEALERFVSVSKDAAA